MPRNTSTGVLQWAERVTEKTDAELAPNKGLRSSVDSGGLRSGEDLAEHIVLPFARLAASGGVKSREAVHCRELACGADTAEEVTQYKGRNMTLKEFE